MSWFDRRLIVVEGKGGVGRTMVTAALALAAGRAGRRVCAMELHGETALAHRLGFADGQYAARAVTPNVDLMSLSPTACLSDFGERKLHIPALSRWFFESRLMAGFVEAVPGLQDVVQLGKVENRLLEPLAGEVPYDLVVLDGPATGHGLTLLSSARAMRQMTRTGPFHDLALIIERLLEDRTRTATVVVTLPELLPVHEAIDLIAALDDARALPDAVIVNQTERALDAPLPLGPALRELPAMSELARLADDLAAADSRQRDALATLDRALATYTPRIPTVRLPRLGGVGATPHPQDLAPLVEALLAAEGLA